MTLLWGIAWALCLGCASNSYHFASNSPAVEYTVPADLNAITFGGEHPRLDQLESVVHYPAKKFRQWFGKQDQSKLSDNEKRHLGIYQSQRYLMQHGITNINIDVREYNPSEQWRRLVSNRDVAPVWKYTAGTLQHIEYCLLPGRVLHRDNYNLFTKTLSINSTQPEQSLYASATAKYLHSKKSPGAFATACHLPVVPLYRDYYVANDVLSYARHNQDWELEKQLYPQIYGSFGGDLVSQATSLVPAFAYVPFYVKPALSIGGRIGGNMASSVAIRKRERELQATRIQPSGVSNPAIGYPDWN